MKQNKFIVAALFGYSDFSLALENENFVCSWKNGNVICQDETQLLEQTCTTSIDRQSGESNSEEVFNRWQDSDTLWEDPEFPASDYSLRWDPKYGDAGEPYTPPRNELVWKRPKEMYMDGVQFRSEPTLFGGEGFPHPNGYA